MKKISISLFVIALIPLLFLICNTPEDPFTTKNIKLKIIQPEHNECIVNKEIPIKVTIKLPNFVDKVHLKYTDNTEHNLIKDISLNPNLNEVIFNVTFNTTGKIELIATSETNNVENFKILDTIFIGMAPYFIQKDLIKSPEKPVFNEPFKLIVDAKVFGDMIYNWTKNSLKINGVTSNQVLNFDSLSENDQGIYQCEISNIWGKDISNTYNLSLENINPKPKILSHPQNATVTIGNSASFNVNASGKNLKFQWQKNNININEATNSGYKTNPATIQDNGSKYKCIVTNNSGYVVSNEAQLIVTDIEVKPKIIKNPESITVYVGETATFTIEAEGTNLEYQWQKNGVNIENAINATLELTEITIENNGSKIRCIVKNKLDSLISENAILTVNNIPKPEIVYHPKDIEVKVGEKAQFDIVANGKNLNYQWQENGKDINNANSSAYILRKCLLENNNTKFRCIVSNSGGKVTSTEAVLTVKENIVSPKILTHPTDKQVLEGENVTFAISASGTKLQYQWKKNGNEINGANNPSFIYTNVKKEDNGAKFKCVVSNSAGTVSSNDAKLTVEEKEIAPNITSDPVDQSKKEGEKVSFSITATGTNLKYQWYKNNSLISGANINVYQIKSIDRKDNGALFKCLVENSKDNKISKEAKLEVYYLDIVQNPQSKTIEYGNEATFTVKAEGFPSNYNYQWKKKGLNVGNNASSYTIPSVSFDDEGQIQCGISNGKADDVLSKSAQLTVKDKAPQILNHPTDQSVSVNSTVTFSVKASGTNLKYQWQCNDKDLQGKTKDKCSIKAEEKLNGSKFTCKVSNSIGEVTSNSAVLNVLFDKFLTVDAKTIALWRFNNMSGDKKVIDEVKNNHPMTLYDNASLTEGKYGNALKGGEKAHAHTPYHADLFPSKTLRVEAIIKLHSYGKVHSMIVSSIYWDPTYGYELRLFNDGKIGFILGTNKNKIWKEAVSETIITLNEWHHIVGDYDGKTITVYLNGKKVGTENYSGGVFPSNNREVHIGKRGYDRPFYFDGLIDEVKISK